MTPADYERLCSWTPAIAADLLPQGAPWRRSARTRPWAVHGFHPCQDGVKTPTMRPLVRYFGSEAATCVSRHFLAKREAQEDWGQ